MKTGEIDMMLNLKRRGDVSKQKTGQNKRGRGSQEEDKLIVLIIIINISIMIKLIPSALSQLFLRALSAIIKSCCCFYFME